MDSSKRRKSGRMKEWLFGKRSKSPAPSESTASAAPPHRKLSSGSDVGSVKSAYIDSKSDISITKAETSSMTAKGDAKEHSNDISQADDKPLDGPHPPEYAPTASEDLWAQAKAQLSEDDQILLDANVKLGPTMAILEEVQEVVDEKERLVEEKTWKIDFGGRKIVLRDVVGKIFGWVSNFKAVGDFVSELDPVHCALPWAAVKLVLSVATGDIEQAGQILIGIELVTCLINRCSIYEQLYIVPDPSTGARAMAELQKSLTLTYKTILSFLAAYIRLMDRNTFTRKLLSTFDPGSMSEMLADLGKYEMRCEVAANNCERLMSSLTRIRQGENQEELRELLKGQIRTLDTNVNKFWKKLEDDERCKIFQWISEVPFETDHYNAMKGRVEGTGQWLLDHATYKQWRDTEASTILWLNGIPGAGKTKLSSKVIDSLLAHTADAKANEAFAYFYCDRNRTDHRDPVVVLRSLVRQLSSSRDESTIIPYVEAKYIERKKSGFSRDQLTSEECQELLLRLTKDYSQCTLAIDGLDECDRDTRCVLMDVLDMLVAEASHPVKIYIASRQDQDLRDRYQLGDHLEVTANDNQADIEKFVLNKLEQSPFCRTKMSKQVRLEILKTFHEKSQGMFQWAALHIDELIKLNRNKDILGYLDKLPRGLEAAYQKIYQDITSQTGSKRDVAFSAFKILMCSWRPLSPAEMVIAATQDLEEDFFVEPDVDIDYVLDACHNFMVVADGRPEKSTDKKGHEEDEDVETGELSRKRYADGPASKYRQRLMTDAIPRASDTAICRFAHLSVREYLELHHWSIAEANAYMACICLRTLLRLQWGDATINDENKEAQWSDGEIDEHSDVDDVDNDEHPWLRVNLIERRTRYQLHWDDSREGSVADPEEVVKDNPETCGPPPFNCFVELYNVHHHDDVSICSSADFDAQIENFAGKTLERWTQYASETWSLHVRRAAQHDGLQAILNDLLMKFLGDVDSSSACYRAWTIFNRGNIDLTMDQPERAMTMAFSLQRPGGSLFENETTALEDFLSHTFSRSQVRPTKDLAFGSTLLGLDHILKAWLEAGKIDANSCNARGESLLHLAIKGNHYNTCKLLLSHGANPDTLSSEFYSPLQSAVLYNRPDIVKLLLEYKADPNMKPFWNATGQFRYYPLRSALTLGQFDCAKVLLEGGAELYQSDALQSATQGGNLKTVRLILDRFTKEMKDATMDSYLILDALGQAWQSALESSAENTAILDLLRDSGIDMEAADSLHEALGAGRMTTVRWLLAQGLDINQKSRMSSYMETPLIRLAMRADSLDMASSLARQAIAAGARVNDVDSEGNTALHKAAENNHWPLAKVLIEAGADLKARKNDGYTVLLTACRHADEDFVSRLIELGVDVNEDSGPDRFELPLRAAYDQTNAQTEEQLLLTPMDIIEKLLDAGAKYEEEDLSKEQREAPSYTEFFVKAVRQKDRRAQTRKASIDHFLDSDRGRWSQEEPLIIDVSPPDESD